MSAAGMELRSENAYGLRIPHPIKSMATLAFHARRDDSITDEQFALAMTKHSQQLKAVEDELRAREKNLREYEERLRALQAQIDASRSAAARRAGQTIPPQTPAVSADEVTLEAAWQKLNRTHEILEAEQRILIDERQAMWEIEAQLKARLEEVTAREAQLAEREARVDAATAEPPQAKPGFAVSRIFSRA
jgi:hypothetical protein